jgi:hypothetical protein
VLDSPLQTSTTPGVGSTPGPAPTSWLSRRSPQTSSFPLSGRSRQEEAVVAEDGVAAAAAFDVVVPEPGPDQVVAAEAEAHRAGRGVWRNERERRRPAR